MTGQHDRQPIDQDTIDVWRRCYGLDTRTPHEASEYWADLLHGMAPAGSVAALGAALDELEAHKGREE